MVDRGPWPLTGGAREQVPPLLLLAPGQNALDAAAADGDIIHDRDLGGHAAAGSA